VAGTPLLQAQTADGHLRLTAAGAWTAPNAAELERLVHEFTVDSSAGGAASIDACDRAVRHLLILDVSGHALRSDLVGDLLRTVENDGGIAAAAFS